MRLRDVAVNAMLLVLFIVIVAVGDVRSSNRARAACLRDAHTAKYIRDSSERALKSLPTIAYYRSHPGELRRAKKNLRVQIDAFPPLDC